MLLSDDASWLLIPRKLYGAFQIVRTYSQTLNNKHYDPKYKQYLKHLFWWLQPWGDRGFIYPGFNVYVNVGRLVGHMNRKSSSNIVRFRVSDTTPWYQDESTPSMFSALFYGSEPWTLYYRKDFHLQGRRNILRIIWQNRSLNSNVGLHWWGYFIRMHGGYRHRSAVRRTRHPPQSCGRTGHSLQRCLWHEGPAGREESPQAVKSSINNHRAWCGFYM